VTEEASDSEDELEPLDFSDEDPVAADFVVDSVVAAVVADAFCALAAFVVATFAEAALVEAVSVLVVLARLASATSAGSCPEASWT
jgi:hypothetical protein